MAGFAWDQPAAFWGVKLSSRPDVLHSPQDASSTCLPLTTTKSGTTVPFEKWVEDTTRKLSPNAKGGGNDHVVRMLGEPILLDLIRGSQRRKLTLSTNELDTVLEPFPQFLNDLS